MITVISALAFAVVLALVYSVLAERFDDASVHRRQFDAWIAIGAFGCWLALASGDLTLRRDIAKLQAEDHSLAARPTEVVRSIVPALRTPAASVASDSIELPDVGPQIADVPGADAQAVAQENGSDSQPGQALSGGDDGASNDDHYSNAVSASAPVVKASSDEHVGILPAVTAAAPVAVRPFVVIVTPTPTPTRPRLAPTAVMPTPVVPTPDVGVIPTATPHCGTPDAIDFTLRIEQAEAERGSDGFKVLYRARIENQSSFPVTLADISITAQNSAAGSEHYGHALRPDITLAPFDRVTIEGSIPLIKSPSPFGRTELCFAMVGETCGERAPYNVRRRCSVVDGF